MLAENKRHSEEKEELERIIDSMKRDIEESKEKDAKYNEQEDRLAALYEHGLIDENGYMIER